MKLLNQKPAFNFMGWRRGWMALSAALILLSIGSLIFRGLNFGVDFTGGLILEVSFAKPVDLQLLRSDLSEAGYADAQVGLADRMDPVVVAVGAAPGRPGPRRRGHPRLCGSRPPPRSR